MLGISLPGQRRVAFTATKWRNRIFPFIRVPIVAFLISTVCRGDITVFYFFSKIEEKQENCRRFQHRNSTNVDI